MGYCTADDIRADFKGIEFLPYDVTPGAIQSATTQEQLVEWIEQESAHIDGVICKIYSLPITLAALRSPIFGPLKSGYPPALFKLNIAF